MMIGLEDNISQLKDFVNNDFCALKPCKPCKFYQGKYANLKPSDLFGKSLGDLINIADKNNYFDAEDRLHSYFWYYAKKCLGKVIINKLIKEASNTYKTIDEQEAFLVYDTIGQCWNNRTITSIKFYAKPRKHLRFPTLNYKVNDDKLDLHGILEFS